MLSNALTSGTRGMHVVAGTVAAMVMVFRLSWQAGIESWLLAGVAALVMWGAMGGAMVGVSGIEPLKYVGWGQAVVAPGIYGTIAVAVIMWVGEG